MFKVPTVKIHVELYVNVVRKLDTYCSIRTTDLHT